MQVISINQQTQVDFASRSRPKDTARSNGQGRFVPRPGASAVIENVKKPMHIHACLNDYIHFTMFQNGTGQNERPWLSESARRGGGGA